VTQGERRVLIHNRVLAVLLLAGLAAAFGLAFLTQAPNRLVSGTGIRLSEVLAAPQLPLLLLAVLVLLAAVFVPPSRRWHSATALAAAALLVGGVALAGDAASRIAITATPLARTSFGGGFWVLVLLCALALADALQRLQLRPTLRLLAAAAVLLAIALLLGGGALDQLSLLKEYHNRQDVFDAALWRHLQIVGCTLAPTLVIGVPLGLAAFRSTALARPLFALLGLIQTVPSIALFGLLIGPLAWAAAALPGFGLSGIGLLPAVIALTLYSLLHVVRSTVAGLGQVPPAVVDAAIGMGLTRTQIFWQVQVPIALPLLLAGLRVCTVQTIGMAVVAALIGAGGFGALMFQGLASSAIDLVLLGVMPVVALAALADLGFGAAIAAASTTRPQ
jgi:osmoprotectant transport system permease protein